MIVNCRIKLSDNVIQNSRGNREDRSTVAAVGGMTYAIGGVLRKEDSLVYVCGGGQFSKVSGERAVPHQHDVVGVRLFLIACAG